MQLHVWFLPRHKLRPGQLQKLLWLPRFGLFLAPPRHRRPRHRGLTCLKRRRHHRPFYFLTVLVQIHPLRPLPRQNHLSHPSPNRNRRPFYVWLCFFCPFLTFFPSYLCFFPFPSLWICPFPFCLWPSFCPSSFYLQNALWTWPETF